MPPQQAALPSPKSAGCTTPPQVAGGLCCSAQHPSCMVPHQRSPYQARNPQAALGCYRAQHGSLCCSAAARTVPGTIPRRPPVLLCSSPGCVRHHPRRAPANPKPLKLNPAAAARLCCSAELKACRCHPNKLLCQARNPQDSPGHHSTGGLCCSAQHGAAWCPIRDPSTKPKTPRLHWAVAGHSMAACAALQQPGLCLAPPPEGHLCCSAAA